MCWVLGAGPLCASLVASPLAVPAPAADWPARVHHVVDGDSLWVRPEGGGRRVKLRLRGIDAPEICQPDGRAARDALRALAQGQPVRVTVHARDRFGRAIADVRRSADGLDLAARMAADGWAWSDDWGHRQGPHAAAQAQARAAGRGLFARPGAERPGDFRRRHGPCGRPG